MLFTFAPSDGRLGDLAAAELDGLERARRFWWTDVWIVSALLAANAVIVVWISWRKRA
jgi:hypothetical protein